MRVLLNVDEGKHWRPVARLVGELARSIGAHVTVVSTMWSASARADAFETALRILDMPAEHVETLARPGLVEDVLPTEAREGEYDLVVLGRLGSLDWLTNGLVASLVVRRIPTNVLVVRGSLERLERFLVCTAGARHGETDLAAALALARSPSADVTVLHVLSQIPLTYEGEAEMQGLRDHFLDTGLSEARHLRDLEARLVASGVRGRTKVRVGPVVEEVLREVHEGRHDLLVLGAHEAGPATDGFLYENIAALLVRASPISFLVVHRDPTRT